MPGVIAVVDGASLSRYCKPWVAVLGHLKGIKSPPQHAIAIDRACWQGEAVAAVVAETQGAGRGCGRANRSRVGSAASGSRNGGRARRPPRDPSRSRRQHLLQARARHRRRGRRLREGRPRRGGNLRFCPPHRRHARAPFHPRRLQRGRARAHRLPLDAGAAHDAGHLLAPPRHPRGQRAGDREGRRRLLRHQGARVCRRDGDRRALGDAAPPGQVRRRPARVVHLRHPRARAPGEGTARLHQGRRDSRLRPR